MHGKVLVGTSALIAVLAAVTYIRYSSNPDYVPAGIQNSAFEEVAPDLFRFNRVWAPVNHVLEIPISVFLIKSGKHYVLIDAGIPGTNYTNLLINGIKTATRSGHLRTILRKYTITIQYDALQLLTSAWLNCTLTLAVCSWSARCSWQAAALLKLRS